MKRIILSNLALLFFVVMAFSNIDANTSGRYNLYINVSGAACSSVTVYVVPASGSESPIQLDALGSCQYGATLETGDYIVYVCQGNVHGDVDVKIINPEVDNVYTLELLSGSCPYGN